MVIDLKPTEASEVNKTELVQIISETCGIDENSFYIKTETNDKGQVIRIIFVVKDEKTAKEIASEVSKIVEEEPEKCDQGIFCRATDVNIKDRPASILSIEEGHRNMLTMMLLPAVVVSSIF